MNSFFQLKFQNGIYFLIFLLMSFSLRAETSQSSDNFDEDPIAATQSLLNNPSAVKNLSKTDLKAREADDFANKAVNNNQADRAELDKITSDAFNTLAKKYNGDAIKMQAELMKALQNPEAFKKSLPIETQARIKALSDNVERKAASESKTKP